MSKSSWGGVDWCGRFQVRSRSRSTIVTYTLPYFQTSSKNGHLHHPSYHTGIIQRCSHLNQSLKGKFSCRLYHLDLSRAHACHPTLLTSAPASSGAVAFVINLSSYLLFSANIVLFSERTWLWGMFLTVSISAPLPLFPPC